MTNQSEQSAKNAHSFDERLDAVFFRFIAAYEAQRSNKPVTVGVFIEPYKQAIKQLIATELGTIIDANIDPDYAVDTDRVYEVLMEWMGELQGGGDE